jgi:hypothetical protein
MYRNKKLLELMRELPCMSCGIQNGTVVAAHSNQSKHGKGLGLKAPDSLVAALCHSCHHELDNGNKLSKEEKRHFWDQAYIKTMQYLIEKELLKINDKN